MGPSGALLDASSPDVVANGLVTAPSGLPAIHLNVGTSATACYGMAGCREVEVDTGQDVQWWFTQELAATALTPPRSWEPVAGARGDALPAEARQDLATAAELERLVATTQLMVDVWLPSGVLPPPPLGRLHGGGASRPAGGAVRRRPLC